MSALEFYIEELRAALEKQDAQGLRRAAQRVITAWDAEVEDEEEE